MRGRIICAAAPADLHIELVRSHSELGRLETAAVEGEALKLLEAELKSEGNKVPITPHACTADNV